MPRTKGGVVSRRRRNRVLKQAKLVKVRKDGKAVYYSLDDDHVKKIFEIGKEHIEEN